MPDISQLGKTQSFEWGTILWFVEPGDLDIERMSVGLITFYPHTTQDEHLHSGDEQVIYVISGAGKQIIDGQVSDLSPGVIKHIPPYTRHKVINDSPAELKLVIVYTPSKFQRLLARPPVDMDLAGETDIRSFLDVEALRGILNRLAEALGLSLAILDPQGRFMVKTDNYPKFCSLLSQAENGGYCHRFIQKAFRDIGPAGRPHLFLCCNDIASIIIPIFNGNSVIGYIKCGEVFLTRPDREEFALALGRLADAYGLPLAELLAAAAEIRAEPKSRLYAAAEATFAIANYIKEMTAAALKQKELDNSRLSLVKEQMATAKLEKALQEADLKLLRSQLNPHFLFNALSTIAQMAYIEGTEKVAALIWSLADLLRFTLRKPEELIPLQEEIKILNNYLHIQKARFGARLEIICDIAPGLDNVPIPCLLLQPLVENAIIHGFEMSMKKGVLKIAARRKGQKLICSIEDNGLGFDPKAPAASKTGIGLSSVRNRLQYYYGSDFEFHIDSTPGKGTAVVVAFPVTGGAADGKH